MRFIFCLLALTICTQFSFAQPMGAPSNLPEETIEGATSASPGYLTSIFYAWNDTLLTWDTLSHYDYTWNQDTITTQIYYRYDNGGFNLSDSITIDYPNGNFRFRTYHWDNSTYEITSEWFEDYDSLDNNVWYFTRNKVNGIWDTTAHSTTDYVYSGQANFDTSTTEDLTQNWGFTYVSVNRWNTAGTEPDSIISYAIVTNNQIVPVQTVYDIQWYNYANHQYSQYTFEMPNSNSQRHTFNYGPFGYTDRLTETWNNGQFDSTYWVIRTYVPQGCLDQVDQLWKINGLWVLGQRRVYINTFDSFDRLIELEWQSLDTATNALYRESKVEYTYPPATSLESQALSMSARVYPNPSQGPIRLSLDLPTDTQLNFQIWDLTGKTLYQENWYQTAGNTNKDISTELPPGFYTYRIKSSLGKVTGTLIRK